MTAASMSRVIDGVRRAAHPLTGGARDYDPLLALVGDARFVLLGEASHGTHEFYRMRAEITLRLVREKGFNVVALEADWPDAYRVNRYVRGDSDDGGPREALGGFRRFPTWMWRNADVLDFIGWLRAHNDGREGAQAGVYGLDLYSLHGSMDEVLRYLDKVDPEAARRARRRYACFEHFGQDTQAYGYIASSGLHESCEDAVVKQLIELRRRAADYARRDGGVAADEYFYAEQNARLVKNAEQYYRCMFRGRVSSWNLRDRHMAETLDALVAHLDQQGRPSKAVVWAHNSHLGDARATDMGKAGELNLGQLVRERYGEEAVLVGFSTYDGTVTAAADWDEPAERKRVRPGLPGSYEALLHAVGAAGGPDRFLLPLRGRDELRGVPALLERAIGVIYRPETERASHYFHALLPEQFDAVLHIDRTRAVEPLEPGAGWRTDDADETFPSGL
jgi:erythromycin esterase-like protein